MNMSELIGDQLDREVAKCEGYEVMLFDQLWMENGALQGYHLGEIEQHLQWQSQKGRYVIVGLRQLQLDQRNPEILTPTRCAVDIPNYSTSWAHGGPIIEREGLAIRSEYDGETVYWLAKWSRFETVGPTPLIAAMRCYVASKLGSEIEIPSEVTNEYL